MVESITMGNIRKALGFCGYDLDEVMHNKTRKRMYADLRSIVWYIYCTERNISPGDASRAFGWNRATIHCALARVEALKHTDRVFCDLYDAISGAYMSYAGTDGKEG
jgi:hypothetical protein